MRYKFYHKFRMLEIVFEGDSLAGANLRDANLRYVNLSNADLSNADLSGVDSSDAYLSKANLRNAYLSNADLRRANLRYANLRDADLRYANLRDADLSDADLSGANLSNANLRDADLSDADLSGANLSNAYLSNVALRYANLSNADLRYADLRYADLSGANLSGADLEGASLPNYSILPEGRIYGWKTVNSIAGSRTKAILKLGVETPNRTNSLVGRKCRADKVVVLGVYNAYTGELLPKDTICHSKHDHNFIYVYTEDHRPIVEPNYDPDIRVECTAGIHFWITIKEALEWEGLYSEETEKRILNGGK